MPIHGLSSISQPFPPHFDIEKVIRPNILALHPYRCARDDYSEGILLDANENSLGHSIPRSTLSLLPELHNNVDIDLHRYPDPSHDTIKIAFSDLRGVPGAQYIFLGVGSDEVIDLIMRVCVAPGKEKILITPPTYGMYAVCAQVNDAGVVKVPLELNGDNGEGGASGRFSLRVEAIKKAIDEDPSIKLIFLCSPGNPTGTLLSLSSIRDILEYEPFKGIVVVDEAYIDFASSADSAVSLVHKYSNICVTQTLSKSFGLAAIRLGVAIAQPPLIQILSNTKAPYNISTPTANLGVAALSPQSIEQMRDKARTLVESRTELIHHLQSITNLGVGPIIGGNDANFVLVTILSKEGGEADNERALKLYKTLAEENGVVVRYRGSEPGCSGCLRITVGTEEEHQTLIRKLRQVLAEI